eukprot:465294_1
MHQIQLLLLFICATLTHVKCVQILQWDNEFEHRTFIDGDAKFEIFWTVLNGTHIEIGMKVESTGYVALGFSPNGDMMHSDIMFAYYDHDDNIILQNRYTLNSRSQPLLSPNQDNFAFISAERVNNITKIRFIRLIHPCTTTYSTQKILKGSTTKLIYAYNDNPPTISSNNDISIEKHQFSNRGSKSIDLLATTQRNLSYYITDDTQSIDITVTNYSLPAVDTKYHCKLFKLFNETEMYMRGIAPIITTGNQQFVHHILMYSCDIHNDSMVGFEQDCDIWSNMNDPHLCSRGLIFFGWAVGEDYIMFENDYSMATPQYVILEIHYDNPEFIDGISDYSGLRIYYTLKPRPNMINILVITDNPLEEANKFFIPAHLSETNAFSYCSKRATQSILKNVNNASIIGAFLHAHKTATAITLRHIRGGVELKPILTNMNYDFNFQEVVLLEEHITILPGDEFIAQCFYDTMNINNMTYIGESTRDEMCFTYILITPTINSDFCSTFAFIDDDWFNYAQKQKWYDGTSTYYNASTLDAEYYYKRLWNDNPLVATYNEKDKNNAIVADTISLPSKFTKYQNIDPICDIKTSIQYDDNNQSISQFEPESIYKMHILSLVVSISMFMLWLCLYILVHFKCKKDKTLSQITNKYLLIAFEYFSQRVIVRPHLFLCIGLIVTCICGVGISFLNEKTNLLDLWMPEDAVSNQYYIEYDHFFGENNFPFYLVDIQLRRKNNVNIFSVSFLDEAWNLYTFMNNMSIHYDNNILYWDDICFKASNVSVNCHSYSSNVFSVYGNNPNNWRNSTKYDLYTKFLKNSEFLNAMYRKIEYKNGSTYPYNAEFMSLRWVFKTNIDIGIINAYYEKIHKYFTKEKRYSFYENFDLFYYMDDPGFKKEMERSQTGDYPLLFIAIFMIILYLMIFLGSFTCIKLRIWLGLTIILEVICELATTLGIMGYVGLERNALTVFIAFMILSVGIDDMIIIVHIYNKTGDMVASMRESGLTVTLSSLSTIFAFVMGGISISVPALKAFCFSSAIAFMANYFIQFLIFVPFLIYDNLRIKQNRNFCCPCITQNDQNTNAIDIDGSNKFSSQNIFKKTVISLLNNSLWRKVGIIFFLIFFLFSIYAVFNTSTDSKLQRLLPDDSYALEFLEIVEDEGQSIHGIKIVFKNQDVSDPYTYQNLINMNNDIEEMPDTIGYGNNWFSDFEFYLKNYAKVQDKTNLTKTELYSYLKDFKINIMHHEWN